MKGFATARALIIDDNPAEVAPIVNALGRAGIASVFHQDRKSVV